MIQTYQTGRGGFRRLAESRRGKLVSASRQAGCVDNKRTGTAYDGCFLPMVETDRVRYGQDKTSEPTTLIRRRLQEREGLKRA